MSGHRQLSPVTRVVLFVVGWTLVLIGIAGLVLPGIQGILTILLGLGVLSVASRSVHRLLRRIFQRWPAVWDRIEAFREKMHDRFGHHED